MDAFWQALAGLWTGETASRLLGALATFASGVFFGVIGTLLQPRVTAWTTATWRRLTRGAARRQQRVRRILDQWKGRVGNYASDFRMVNWFATWAEACALDRVRIALAHVGDPVREGPPPPDVAPAEWRARIAAIRRGLEDPAADGHDGDVLRVRRLRTGMEQLGRHEAEYLDLVCESVKYSVHRARMDHVRAMDRAARDAAQDAFIDGTAGPTPLSGAVAVNVMIRTEDDRLLFARRGAGVQAARRQFTCGVDEMLRQEDRTGDVIRLETVIVRTLREELGIRPRAGDATDIGTLVGHLARVISCEMRISTFDFGIGVGVDLTRIDDLMARDRLSPDQAAMARAKFAPAAIEANIRNRTHGDTVEIAEVRFLPLDPESLARAFAEAPGDYDDSAFMMAAVALHGLGEFPLDRIEAAFT
jgi:hypothetical protein